MTQAQEAYLSVAKSENVAQLMQDYGFEFVGPSHKDVFLFKTTDGRAWLLTDIRGKVAPCRMVLPSAWTDQNIAVISPCDYSKCTLRRGHVESCIESTS